MATADGDILLDGEAYRLTAGGHRVSESIRTRPAPANQPRSLSQFEHQNDYIYFGQGKLLGQGFPIWQGDGPFDIGYGLNMDPEGTMGVADTMVLGRADSANTDGYVGFRIGYPPGSAEENRIIFMGRNDGKSHVRKQTAGWQAVDSGINPSKAVSHGFFSRITLIGASDGKLYRTDDGFAFTDEGRPDASVTGLDANILGSFKGQLYVGYSDGSIWKMNADLTWDTADGPFLEAGTLDMTPIIGASGTNVLYIITEGPSPRILFTDGKELFQANVITSDFNPRAAVFFGKLFLFGEQGFDVATKGAAWTLGALGIAEELSFGDASVNQGIFTAQVEGEVILWGATGNTEVPSGIGVWDPRLDQSPDAALGYYVSNIAAGTVGSNKVSGLAALAGKRYMGLAGVGIYETTTPGTFMFRTGLYGADQRNIDKRWPVGQIHHSALGVGQTISLKSRKDKESSYDTWGTNSVDGTTEESFPSPTDYRSPYLQIQLTGTAAGLDLTVYDVALGYIQATNHDDIKRTWSLRIAIEGFENPKLSDPTKGLQYTRQGVQDTRTSMEMKTALDLLWNKEVCFEDIDGTTYKVLVKAASEHPNAGFPSRFGELDRHVTAGVVDNLSLVYELTLVETGTC